jgi:hypothetical protein
MSFLRRDFERRMPERSILAAFAMSTRTGNGQMVKNCLHAACGFLLGLSIAISLLAFRLTRRCRETQI